MFLRNRVQPHSLDSNRLKQDSRPAASQNKSVLHRIIAAALVLGLSTLGIPQSMAQSARKAITKEAPVFPSEALDEGINSGTVKARLSVAPDGSVTGVEITEADPPRVFNKAVTRAVTRWKYEATGTADTLDVQLTFKTR